MLGLRDLRNVTPYDFIQYTLLYVINTIQNGDFKGRNWYYTTVYVHIISFNTEVICENVIKYPFKSIQ